MPVLLNFFEDEMKFCSSTNLMMQTIKHIADKFIVFSTNWIAPNSLFGSYAFKLGSQLFFTFMTPYDSSRDITPSQPKEHYLHAYTIFNPLEDCFYLSFLKYSGLSIQEQLTFMKVVANPLKIEINTSEELLHHLSTLKPQSSMQKILIKDLMIPISHDLLSKKFKFKKII